MPVPIDATRVQAIAPDAAAITASRRLARPEAWAALGRSERAAWGELARSGYRTRAALTDLAASCSCPSRKVPCKHALALLFLVAEPPQNVAFDSAEPEWVQSWFSERERAAARREARASRRLAPVDPEARAQRSARRHQNVLSGMEQLDVWMADLVRHGLARLPAEGLELWDAQARRLVDAQAPALASRIRAIGHRVGVGDAWMERVLGDLGRVALLTEAYRRLDTLPDGLRDDVRRWVGYTLDKAEVIARGETIEDDWVVVSVVVRDEEPLRMRRVWLVGQSSARKALLLDVAAGSAVFEHEFRAGTATRAKLAFWPSARPERALVVARSAERTQVHAPPHARSIPEALDDYATGLARDPWLERTLVILLDVVVARHASSAWYAVGANGDALRLRGTDHEVVYALSGGRPLCLVAEWNGFVLDPLSAHVEGRTVGLQLGDG